jgi:hypothetical protein
MLKNNKISISCIGLTAAILSGCATQNDVLSSRILGSSRGSQIQHTTYQYAAGNRDLKTTIIGNPFKVDKSIFDTQVTQLMRGNDRGINGNFTTKPKSSAKAGYHAVMLFNPSSGVSLNRVCSAPENEKSTGGTDTLSALLVFCGPTPISAGHASANSVSLISDLRFTQLIQDVTFYMTPVEPPVSYD